MGGVSRQTMTYAVLRVGKGVTRFLCLLPPFLGGEHGLSRVPTFLLVGLEQTDNIIDWVWLGFGPIQVRSGAYCLDLFKSGLFFILDGAHSRL